MKNLKILIFALCFLNLCATAQENATPITDVKFDNEYANRTNPIINGKIINASEQEVQNITLEFTLVRPNEPIQTKLTTGIDKDGKFQLVIPSKLPYQQIWFSLGEYVYSCLYANEELNLEFDLQKLKKQNVYMLGDGMSFSGKDGEINKTLNAYIMYNKKHLPEFYKEIQNLNDQDPNALKKLDSLFKLQRKIDGDFLKDSNHNAKEIIESETEAEYLSKKILLLLNNNEVVLDNKELMLPIFAVTNGTTSFLRYLHWYISNKKLSNKEERVNRTIKFSKLDSILPKPYADLVKLQVYSRDLPEQLAINKELIKSLNTKWISQYLLQENAELNNKINKMQELLSEKTDSTFKKNIGKFLKRTSFNGTLYLNESETGENLLKSIMAAFPKKIIILDLWATWCFPCLNNMPHSKQLFQQVQNEKLPVVFVYLCTDLQSSETLWQNKIAELEQPGEHIFVSNKQMNELMDLFNTSGYPTYAIIKPDGQIDTKTINLNRKFSIDELKKYLSKEVGFQ